MEHKVKKKRPASSSSDSSVNLTDDSLPEPERRYIPFSSTPADEEVGNSLDISSSLSIEGSPELCVNCSLIQCSLNISELLLLTNKVELQCCTTVCLNYTNPVAIFTKAFCSKVIEKEMLKKNILEKYLKNNVKSLFINVLDLLEHGRLQFYSHILEYVEVCEKEDKDRIITFVNEIANLFVEVGVKEFENGLAGRIGRVARKSLVRYMKQTSNFLSLQAVVETMIIFYRKGVDINTFLPDSFSFLADSFANIPKDQNSLGYHNHISSITRKIILDVLHESSIAIYEITEETFMNDIIPAGRDLFLYLNKTDNILCHLVVFSPAQLYLERIKVESITINEEAGTVETDHWKFKLKAEANLTYLKELKNSLMEKDLIKDYGHEEETTDRFETGDSNNNEEEIEEIEEETGSEESKVGSNYEEAIQNLNKKENILPATDEENDTTKDAEFEVSFKIKQNDIKHYWDPKHRIFYRETTGKDWSMMYSCPCALVIGYDRAKVFNSRNRNSSFAKLTGKCIICNSVHFFEVKKSPFVETLQDDGSIQYKAVSDMMVYVWVKGRFHITDGNPDIKRPFHLKECAKGLDLRGEERRLLGMKASLEGASSVYREGMAYLQRDQIEASNRTSIRSLPVIR